MCSATVHKGTHDFRNVPRSPINGGLAKVDVSTLELATGIGLQLASECPVATSAGDSALGNTTIAWHGGEISLALPALCAADCGNRTLFQRESLISPNAAKPVRLSPMRSDGVRIGSR